LLKEDENPPIVTFRQLSYLAIEYYRYCIGLDLLVTFPGLFSKINSIRMEDQIEAESEFGIWNVLLLVAGGVLRLLASNGG